MEYPFILDSVSVVSGSVMGSTRRDETDCPHCFFPHRRSDEPSKCPNPGEKPSNTHLQQCPKCGPSTYNVEILFHVSGRGKVPVIHGDPNILPTKVKDFIAEQIRILRPVNIHICTGTVFEEERIRQRLIDEGRLEESYFPDVFKAYSHMTDTEKHGNRVFLDYDAQQQAAIPSSEVVVVSSRARDELCSFFTRCMRGRTLYVIPYSLGPIGSRFSHNVVQVTDCPYTVLTTRCLARVSSSVWDAIGAGDFIRCIHTVGAPRPVLDEEVHRWPCNRTNAFILINVKRKRVHSFGTAHFASALCRNSVSLRLASYIGHKHEWSAVPAAIISVTDDKGEERFMCAHGGLGKGRSTIAFLQSTLKGWKVRPISSNFAWLRWGNDGKMYAMSPENGFCVQWSFRESMMEKLPIEAKAIRRRSLLLNVHEKRGDLQWSAREDNVNDPYCICTRSSPPRPKSCAIICATDVETIHPNWDYNKGFPISAYIFMYNRPCTVPVLSQSKSWKDGIALALLTRTIKETAIEGDSIIHDPLGMNLYLTYKMSSLVKEWLSMEKEGREMPVIFHLNLFRRNNKFKALSPVTPPHQLDSSSIISDRILLNSTSEHSTKEHSICWPGFGDNIRLLKWIHGRILGKEEENCTETPIGTVVPKKITEEGLSGVEWNECVQFDRMGWLSEVKSAKKYLPTMQLNGEEYSTLALAIRSIEEGINKS